LNSNTTQGQEDTDVVKPSMTEIYLNYLLQLENQENDYFYQSIPPPAPKFSVQIPSDVYRVIQRGRGMVCHTAMIPSEARFEGVIQMQPFLVPANDTIVDNTIDNDGTNKPTAVKYVPRPKQKQGHYTHGGMYSSFERGYGLKDDEPHYYIIGSDIHSPPPVLPPPNPLDNTTEPYLVATLFESDLGLCRYERQDFRDYFLIRKEDYWMTVIVPNDMEVEKYRRRRNPIQRFDASRQGHERQGLVIICEKYFIGDDVSPDALRWNEANFTEDLHVMVNGVTGKLFIQAVGSMNEKSLG